VKWSGRDSNLQPIGCKSDALSTCHHATHLIGWVINNAVFVRMSFQDLKKKRPAFETLYARACAQLLSIFNLKKIFGKSKKNDGQYNICMFVNIDLLFYRVTDW